MNPVWFFTSEALMNYMPTAVPLHKPWDLAFIGAKLEAFAIAGCDIVSKSIIIHGILASKLRITTSST
jgi:hypothetical protein